MIDTNILIRALLSENSYCGRIFELLLQEKIQSYTSTEILEEMQRVIYVLQRRKRLDAAALLLVQIFKEHSTVIEDPPHIRVVKEDPDDDKFFACALVANVDYILSEDNHLLQHNPWRGILICTAKEFLEQQAL